MFLDKHRFSVSPREKVSIANVRVLLVALHKRRSDIRFENREITAAQNRLCFRALYCFRVVNFERRNNTTDVIRFFAHANLGVKQHSIHAARMLEYFKRRIARRGYPVTLKSAG